MENKYIIPYKPLPYQKVLHDDSHRFKVIVAGRRVGKTIFAINELIKLALTRNLPIEFWYVAPYINQAKMIAWTMLLKYAPKELLAKKPNESELSVEFINGATIALKGADNPKGLEGTGLGAVVIDEVASISQSHFDFLWDHTLRPMLLQHTSPAIFISKPRGFNHFHDLAKIGDHNNIIEGESLSGGTLDPDFITYRFETEQNCREHNGGYLPHKEIEAVKKQSPPEVFDQEYRAKFTHYSDLVHKSFDRAIHVIPSFNVPKSWRRVRGWDFGSAHPTASVRIAVDSDDNWFIEYCYKVKDKTIEYHARQIKDQDSDLKYVAPGHGDPSGKQWISEFKAIGIPIVPARRQENTTEKNWVQLGIDKINEKLVTKVEHTVFLPDGTKLVNAPSFFILNRPENRLLIDELETLAYKESQNGINDAIVDETRDRNGHYDLHAALRYVSVSGDQGVYFTVVEINEEQVKSQLVQDDKDIKEMSKDPERRKPFELEEDLKIMKEEFEKRRNW